MPAQMREFPASTAFARIESASRGKAYAIFVSEGNLARLATEVRGAIGDSVQHSRFVRTVYGFGYSFSGELLLGPRFSARGRPIRRPA